MKEPKTKTYKDEKGCLIIFDSENKRKRFFRADLNGRYFTYDKMGLNGGYGKRRSLHDVYGRCSTAKENVWREWESFFNKLGADVITVVSHNCMKFTIGATFTIDGTRFAAYITSSNNYIRELF